jgi:uncharacterized protein
MASNLPVQDPLSDEEIEELDDFLLDAEGIDESMNVSMLDGFLTALICAPKLILPSEWMRWVWDTEHGKDSPNFSSEDEAGRILSMLMRHMNDITHTLCQAPEYYEPLLLENINNGNPIPILDEWCMGFVKGMSLDEEGWSDIAVANPQWLSTIFLYGTEKGWETLLAKDIPLEEHIEMSERLTTDVLNIYAGLKALRESQISQARPSTVSKRVLAVESDTQDPAGLCPCGSGKKFKLCHGEPGRLH